MTQRRIVRRKPPPKVKTEKRYVCPSCQGVLQAMPKHSLEQIKMVHEETCPASLRMKKK